MTLSLSGKFYFLNKIIKKNIIERRKRKIEFNQEELCCIKCSYLLWNKCYVQTNLKSLLKKMSVSVTKKEKS